MTKLTDQLPPSQDWLVRRITKLEADVRELRSGRGLELSNHRGGRLLFQDTHPRNRDVRGNVGLDGSIGGLTTAYGSIAYGDGGLPVTGSPGSPGAIIRMYREGDRGWSYPEMPFPLHPVDSFNVTSSSFSGFMEGFIAFPQLEVLFVDGAIITDGATTGEIRLRENTSGVTTDALSIPANTNRRYSFTWLHPAPTGLYDPRDTGAVNLSLALDARRISGTSMTMFAPLTVYLTSRFMRPAAATNGFPQLG